MNNRPSGCEYSPKRASTEWDLNNTLIIKHRDNHNKLCITNIYERTYFNNIPLPIYAQSVQYLSRNACFPLDKSREQKGTFLLSDGSRASGCLDASTSPQTHHKTHVDNRECIKEDAGGSDVGTIFVLSRDALFVCACRAFSVCGLVNTNYTDLCVCVNFISNILHRPDTVIHVCDLWMDVCTHRSDAFDFPISI